MPTQDVSAATRRDQARAVGPRWSALPVILAGGFITTLDFFIVNVAIPSMQRDLHAGSAAVQWIVAGFGLAAAVALITSGRLGDLYGRRRMFALGLALFTLASLACGIAQTSAILIAGRVVQGLATAIVTPQVLSIIGVLYTGRDRAKAFTAYGLSLGLGAVFGQLIGGLLIQANAAGLGWRTCFLVNVPVCAVALALTPRLVPESRAPHDPARSRASQLDPTGTALITLALVALVLPLVQGRAQGWPDWAWACLAAAVPLLLAFAVHQRRRSGRGATPLIDLTMFRERAFAAGVILSLVFFAGMASFFLVLVLYLQEGRGLDALAAGALFTPMGVSYLASTLCTPRLAGPMGRQLLTVGGLVIAAGQVILLVTVERLGMTGNTWLLTPALLVLGTGMGLVVAPLSATVLARTSPNHAGAASGVLSTAQYVGNALGVAVIGVVFYGALGPAPRPAAFPHAIEEACGSIAVIALAVAAGVQFLPRGQGHEH
jgi:EmrB/QacA subfamily drug resistance transporter